MDRYKECERFLKVAVAQQCKERGSLIKQDFAAVGKTTTGKISQIADASELIRQCFSMRGTADYQVLRKGCDILIDTLNFADHGNETEGSDERQTIRKDRSLAEISKLLKECVFDESDLSVCVCRFCSQLHGIINHCRSYLRRHEYFKCEERGRYAPISKVRQRLL